MVLSVFNLHSDGKKSITINYSLQLNTHYRIEFTVLKTINSISQLTKRTNHFTPAYFFFFFFPPLTLWSPSRFKGKQYFESKNNNILYRAFSLLSLKTNSHQGGYMCRNNGIMEVDLAAFLDRTIFLSLRLGWQIASPCFNGMIIIVSYLVHPKLSPAAPSTD